jgi:hypothetical protein
MGRLGIYRSPSRTTAVWQERTFSYIILVVLLYITIGGRGGGARIKCVVMVIFLRGLCTLLDGDEKFECLFIYYTN